MQSSKIDLSTNQNSGSTQTTTGSDERTRESRCDKSMFDRYINELLIKCTNNKMK